MQLRVKPLVRLQRVLGRRPWSRCGTETAGAHERAPAQGCRFYASGCAYSRAFAAARDQPEVFWGERGLEIDWFQPWTKTVHVEDPVYPNWFVGGKLNMCYNAVDRHVESGHGEQPAIIHDSPVTGTKRIITFRELQDEVSKLAGVLVMNGVCRGDLVVIYMPMVPEAMITMLACARIGAPHSLIFGGFASKELSVRIDHAKPKLMVTASFGIEPGRRVEYIPLVKKALEMSRHRPTKVLIYNRPNMEKVFLSPELSLDWEEEMASARPHDCVSLPSDHPLYVLYTSGTTGTPKGLVRDTAGYAVMLKWTMSNIYGLKPGDIWWAASDLGWVVGHSYICYGPLLHRNSTILYEVGSPAPAPVSGGSTSPAPQPGTQDAPSIQVRRGSSPQPAPPPHTSSHLPALRRRASEPLCRRQRLPQTHTRFTYGFAQIDSSPHGDLKKRRHKFGSNVQPASRQGQSCTFDSHADGTSRLRHTRSYTENIRAMAGQMYGRPDSGSRALHV